MNDENRMTFDIKIIDDHEDISICEIKKFPERKFSILEAMTAVDFLHGTFELIYKVTDYKKEEARYYGIITDSVVLKFTLTKEDMIGVEE